MEFIIGLFLAFVVFGLLLSIVFLNKKKGDRYANRLLALYTFLFAFELLNNVLRWSGALRTETFVHFNLVHFPLWAIYGHWFIHICGGLPERSVFNIPIFFFSFRYL